MGGAVPPLPHCITQGVDALQVDKDCSYFTFRHQLAVCVYLPLVSLFRTWRRRVRRAIHAGLGLENRKERDSLQDL